MLKFSIIFCVLLLGVLKVEGQVQVNNGVIDRLNIFSQEGTSNEKKELSPVIFVPGYRSSRIDAKLNRSSVVNENCTKSTEDFFNLYLNPSLLKSDNIDCFADNIKLHYDNTTRMTSNSHGVETKIPGFGKVEVVEFLDPEHRTGAYFLPISETLVKHGYVRDVSLRGAPFDWRKAPNEQQQWFIDVKNLVEETYERNKNQPITFISHSYGVSMTMIFFRQQTVIWKRKYIARMISLSGSYGGTAQTLMVYPMGEGLPQYGISGCTLRDAEISMPSLAFLLPFPIFWKEDEVLVTTKKRNYTRSQYKEFFDDLKFPTGWEYHQDNLKYIDDFSSPRVEIHCLYGSGIKTVSELKYEDDELDGTPELIYGDGDGTINERSLKGCKYWERYQRAPIKTYEIPKAEHSRIIASNETLTYIYNVLIKTNQ